MFVIYEQDFYPIVQLIILVIVTITLQQKYLKFVGEFGSAKKSNMFVIHYFKLNTCEYTILNKFIQLIINLSNFNFLAA